MRFLQGRLTLGSECSSDRADAVAHLGPTWSTDARRSVVAISFNWGLATKPGGIKLSKVHERGRASLGDEDMPENDHAQGKELTDFQRLALSSLIRFDL